MTKGQSMSQGHLCTYADWQGWKELLEPLPCILMASFIPQADFAENIPSTDYERRALYHHTPGGMSCLSVNSFMPWVTMPHMPVFSLICHMLTELDLLRWASDKSEVQA